jgi:hypothetical protein
MSTEKESFEERIKLARKEAAERKANMNEEELQQLKEASNRHSKKVRDEILTSYELDRQRKKAASQEE